MLSQKTEDGKIHPVHFASMTISSSEKKYAFGEWEALGIALALEKLRVYLLSSSLFTVIMDHQAFRYTFQRKNVRGRVSRGWDFLAEYDFKIERRTEKMNAQ